MLQYLFSANNANTDCKWFSTIPPCKFRTMKSKMVVTNIPYKNYCYYTLTKLWEQICHVISVEKAVEVIKVLSLHFQLVYSQTIKRTSIIKLSTEVEKSFLFCMKIVFWWIEIWQSNLLTHQMLPGNRLCCQFFLLVPLLLFQLHQWLRVVVVVYKLSPHASYLLNPSLEASYQARTVESGNQYKNLLASDLLILPMKIWIWSLNFRTIKLGQPYLSTLATASLATDHHHLMLFHCIQDNFHAAPGWQHPSALKCFHVTELILLLQKLANNISIVAVSYIKI
jgi:hypothetical protein